MISGFDETKEEAEDSTFITRWAAWVDLDEGTIHLDREILIEYKDERPTENDAETDVMVFHLSDWRGISAAVGEALTDVIGSFMVTGARLEHDEHGEPVLRNLKMGNHLGGLRFDDAGNPTED